MCEAANLKTINRNCGSGSAPDLEDVIYLTPMASLGAVGAKDAATETISTITLNSGAKWERFFIEKDKNGYDSGREGSHYNHKVEAFIERLAGEKTATLNKIRKMPLAVVFTDNNGNKRLMQNAHVMNNEQTATDNGYKLEIVNGKSPDPLPYYTGPLPLA